jgi:uncharacterized membrane protein
MSAPTTFVSDLSGKEFPIGERISAKLVRPSLLVLIRKDHPSFTESGSLSIVELNSYRERYEAEFLKTELGELSKLDQMVLQSVQQQNILTDKVDDEDEGTSSLGQRLADKVAAFGGSWAFILSFAGFLLVWITVNTLVMITKPFDPYPFILLNLILSSIAALQAPVIMMSQNRQEEKDRERSRKDYMINLKSEVEIRMLHEKLDHLIMHQQQELIEIQKLQIDMMTDILAKLEHRSKPAPHEKGE